MSPTSPLRSSALLLNNKLREPHECTNLMHSDLDIDPLTDGVQIGAFSAWDLISTTSTEVSVDVDGQVAGESVIVSKSWPLVKHGKVSFSIEVPDPLTGLPVNCVTDLQLSVDGGNPIPVTSTVVKNTPGSTPNDPLTGALDFQYTTNAGTNGHFEYLQDGDARTILNNDAFIGNQDGGADGSALAWAVLDPITLTFGTEGEKTLKLTGIVKGNSATLPDTSFLVTANVSIVTPGCTIQ